MRRFATLTTILFAGSIVLSSAFAQTAGIKPKSKGEQTAVQAMISATGSGCAH